MVAGEEWDGDDLGHVPTAVLLVEYARKMAIFEGMKMVGEITLVDRGRGLQLSTSRITVMDFLLSKEPPCW